MDEHVNMFVLTAMLTGLTMFPIDWFLSEIWSEKPLSRTLLKKKKHTFKCISVYSKFHWSIRGFRTNCSKYMPLFQKCCCLQEISFYQSVSIAYLAVWQEWFIYLSSRYFRKEKRLLKLRGHLIHNVRDETYFCYICFLKRFRVKFTMWITYVLTPAQWGTFSDTSVWSPLYFPCLIH